MAARANPTISLFYARCKKAKIFFGATFSEDDCHGQGWHVPYNLISVRY